MGRLDFACASATQQPNRRCLEAVYHKGFPACRHHKVASEDGISSMIEGFDKHHIGPQQPRKAHSKVSARPPGQVLNPTASSSSLASQDELPEAGPYTHVQVSAADIVALFNSVHQCI